MTWGQIKTAIEAQGVKDDDAVDYIDIQEDDATIKCNRDAPTMKHPKASNNWLITGSCA